MHVAIPSLWLPVVLSSVLVWIASAVVWTVLPHRKREFKRLPDEAGMRNTLNAPPGEYMIPFAHDHSAGKDPDFLRKYEEAPVGFVRVLPSGAPAMGKPMILFLVFCLVAGIFVAYLTG